MRQSFLPAQNLWAVCAELKISGCFVCAQDPWALLGAWCLLKISSSNKHQWMHDVCSGFWAEQIIDGCLVLARDLWVACAEADLSISGCLVLGLDPWATWVD